MQAACSEQEKEPNDRSPLRRLEPARAKEIVGDGNHGGRSQRPDAERFAFWQAAVAETRELLKGART
jgi:creatinine amidohydrolase